MFNEIDVAQSDKLVTLSFTIYITKILTDHNRIKPTNKSPISSPMNHDKKLTSDMENTTILIDILGQATLQKETGFAYRQEI